MVAPPCEMLVEHAVERLRRNRPRERARAAQVVEQVLAQLAAQPLADRHAEAALRGSRIAEQRLAARRRIHLVAARARAAVGQRRDELGQAVVEERRARSSDAAIVMRSARSSRLSGSQLVWSKYSARRRLLARGSASNGGRGFRE